jgi:hypothetical protein
MASFILPKYISLNKEINNSIEGDVMAEKRRINVNLDHNEPAFFSDYLVVSH